MDYTDEMLLRTRGDIPVLLVCPECDRDTEALKDFHFVDEFFSAIFKFKFTTMDYLACPRCMRSQLLKRLGGTIVSANFYWPFILLPHYSYLLALTAIPGHSRSVKREFTEAYRLALRRKAWAEADHLERIQSGRDDR
ncbi:MAG: hypothetical protein U0176_25225 [Bacteroidia bacterium]